MFKFVIYFVVYFPLLELRILGVIEIICLTYYFPLIAQIEGQELSMNEWNGMNGHKLVIRDSIGRYKEGGVQGERWKRDKM